MFDNVPLTLAQEDAAPATAAPRQAPASEKSLPPDGRGASRDGEQGASPPGLFGPETIFILLIVFVFMMIFSTRSQGKERKRREKMIASMKKGMKVQTVGGIIGSVVDVHNDFVVLKVDENANTRIKFARSSIQSVTEEKDEG